jgi:hypothetical protein
MTKNKTKKDKVKEVEPQHSTIESYDVILGEEESKIFAAKSEKVYQESIALMKKMKLNML